MKNLKLKNGLNNNFISTPPPPPPPPPQHAVNEALTSLFCLLAFLFLYACSSSDPSPIPPNSTTTHKVTFDVNKPNGVSATVTNPPSELTVNDNTTATEPTTLPTLDGYTFDGWYTEASTTTAFLFSTKITKATTLYAKWTPLQAFTLTYHANKPSDAPADVSVTGVPENPISISEGQTATAPTPPTLTGYDFAEWYTEATATNPYDFSQGITANIELYAKWNIQQFTITYHGNKPQDLTANVTGVPDPVNVDYNQTTTLPTPPTLTGYNFVGWYTEATTTNPFDFSQVITANIDLYAKWSQDPVVSFDTQGGSLIDPQRLTGTIKRATRPNVDPTREDYTFDNWYTTAETGTTLFNFDQDITAQSTTVYARWNRIIRTITYHGNKPSDAPEDVIVTGVPENPVSISDGQTATAPTTIPELQDYDFQGWYAGTITGTTPALESIAFAFPTTAIKADLHLYAKWSRTQITVTYHGRKPSTAPEDASITGLTTDPTIVTVNSGETTTALIPAPELTGYMLDGWYKATSSTTGTITLENTAFDFAQPIRGENINLYTKWLQQFTVTYHGNKPSDAPDDATVTGVPENPESITEGQTAKAPTPPILTGYNFVAWYTEATATNQFDFSQGITTSIDLYAKWSQDPVVIFDTQGGSPIDPQRLTGIRKIATRPDEPTRDDYIFENWFTLATGGTFFDFTQTITAQSTTVYARWDRITRTITYHGNKPDTVPRGVSVTSLPDPATVNVNSGDTATPPATPPALQDYDFQGWYAGTTESTAFAFPTTAIKADLHLYAKWTRTQITVTYHGNKPDNLPAGVSVTNLPDPVTIFVNSGDMATEPTVQPELQDYDFQGWFAGTTTPGTTPILQDTAFAFTTTKIRGENINLYAKWTRKQITVTYHGRKPSTAPTDASITGLTTDPTIVTVNSGETTAPIPAPLLTGYAFEGWYKATASTTGAVTLESIAFDFDQPVRGENINLYTKWIQQFRVTYHGNKPQGVTENVSGVPDFVTVNINLETSSPTTVPTLVGYTFEGWYTEQATTRAFVFTTPITANIDLYAKWTIKVFTVTYNANKPSGATANVTGMPTNVMINYNLTTSKPAPAPELTGYNFAGWYTEAAATNVFRFSTPITANIDLYAKWTTSQTVTVTYNVNKPSDAIDDVKDVPASENVIINEMTTAPIPAPTLTNYKLVGWYTDEATTTEFVFSTEAITANMDLYAKWRFRPETKAALVAELNRVITDATPSPNLNYIDTSLIKDMSYLFQNKSNFNGNISSWNVSKVENMTFMFGGTSSFNQNISSWNVSLVENMQGMFGDARVFNGNISSWNVSLVENMQGMFSLAFAFNQNISSWNVSLVKDMSYMFENVFTFNGNISSWNVAKVTNMYKMFKGAVAFNGNISSWNVAKVTNMSNMFSNALAFNQNLSIWNVEKVTDMSGMFYSATAFNGDISNWRPTALTTMNNMFQNASAFTQNINSWNIASSVLKTDAFTGSGLEANLPTWAM